MNNSVFRSDPADHGRSAQKIQYEELFAWAEQFVRPCKQLPVWKVPGFRFVDKIHTASSSRLRWRTLSCLTA